MTRSAIRFMALGMFLMASITPPASTQVFAMGAGGGGGGAGGGAGAGSGAASGAGSGGAGAGSGAGGHGYSGGDPYGGAYAGSLYQ